MKVTVTQMTPSPSGLVLGLRIEHEKAGWIRFATTVVLVNEMSREDRASLYKALDKAVNDVLDGEIYMDPLF